MKSALSTRIASDVLARARATVVGMQRLHPDYTFGRFVEDAFIVEIRRLEGRFNDDKPFPESPPLKPGARLQPPGARSQRVRHDSPA